MISAALGTPDADPAVLLALADTHRDAREWPAAARHYAGYLQARPDDWPIWVQYGHCVKEAGDPRGALLLYREAERRAPEDPDVHVQIGHVLKLLGRAEDAFEEYARALVLDPEHAPALAEVMGAPPPAEAAPPEPRPVAAAAPRTVVFDASDLFDYFRDNRAPTGIQRVQLNIIRDALAAPMGAEILVTAFDPAAGTWKPVPAALFQHLAALAGSGTATGDAAWQAATGALQEALRTAPGLTPPAGSALVNLGTSWWLPDYLLRVREAQAGSGLRYIPFVHDCIPLLVPEHCAAALVDDFAHWFAGVCLHADAVLTNSECTRADFLAAQRRLLPDLALPTGVVRLDAADPPPAAAPLPAAVRHRPFVLMVGTIESRKNHLLAFNAWLALIRRHGAAAVPDLVCVGKRGWLADAALALHANSAALRAKVHLLHDVPDPELAALYDGCLFTLYTSHYEGWGLPVTESLAHGKVPVVPRHSSLIEAGGEAAVFFTPQSQPELVEAVERLLFEDGFRKAREALIAALPPPRPWSAVAAEVLRFAATASLAEPPPPPLDRLRLRLGETIGLHRMPGGSPSLGMAAADAIRAGLGWHPPETWGVWTGPGPCRLRLPVEAGTPPARLRIYLDAVAPDGAVRFAVRAFAAGTAPGPFREAEAAGAERFFIILEVTAAGGDVVEVEFETPQPAEAPGAPGRQVGIGLRHAMLCRADDWSARLDWLERATLPRIIGAL